MLLRLDADGVQKLIERYDTETNEIKKSALSMSWYMRGGVGYNDILNMSFHERKFISDIIEKNMEITKESQLPFF